MMNNFNNVYEKIRPMIIWLGLFELSWIAYWLLPDLGGSDIQTNNTIVWTIMMLFWLYTVIKLVRKGVYLKYSYLFSNLIGFFAVIIFPIVLFGRSESAIDGLVQAANQVSDYQLIGFHVLRLLAIGTIIKYRQGQLPFHFFIFGSMPDFLFSLSAVALLLFDSSLSLGSGFYLIWHCVGMLVFFGAGISMFLSVPSVIRIYHDKPDTTLVFSFPMVLAPNFTVPLFVVAHLFAVLKITMGS
jgi:hypothetical protein